MTEHRIIPIEKIRANPHQPREQFDEESLFELAQSIRENGLIQPIVVREVDHDQFEIIAGERRYRAMLMIGKLEIPSIITQASDENSAALALIENIQREDLNVVEEAHAYRSILKAQNITQKELAKRVGKSQGAIANKIRILELPDNVLSKLATQEITERHARALLSADKEHLDEFLDKIIKERLNVKQTELLVQKPKKPIKPIVKGFSRDVKVAVNTIKQAIVMVEKTGIDVKQEIEESEEEVVMIIRFKK